MKKLITTLLAALATATTFAHGEVELGPNGGRILEFSTNESMHGEVTVKDGKFLVAVLDKDMKPVALDKQTLTAVTGNPSKPATTKVEKVDGKFVLPVVKHNEWVIFQFKPTPEAKPITARLKYNTSNCPPCGSPEWICKCTENEEKKKDDSAKPAAPKKGEIGF